MKKRDLIQMVCGTVSILGFALASCGGGGAASDTDLQLRVSNFDKLFDVVRKQDPSTVQEIAMFNRSYRAQISRMQTPQYVARLRAADVALLFNTAYETQSMTDDPRYVADMELDLAALVKDGPVPKADYESLYYALVSSRMFPQASAVRERHGTPEMPPVPSTIDRSGRGHAVPTVLLVRDGGRVLVRQNFNVDRPAQVVVIASPRCHFAQHSLRDIETDPKLAAAFTHATWLVPPDAGATPIAEVAQWNRLHPKEQMELAYSYHEWPMIHGWNLPTFYFFERDRLVSQVIGWPGGGRKAEIAAALRRVHLL